MLIFYYEYYNDGFFFLLLLVVLRLLDSFWSIRKKRKKASEPNERKELVKSISVRQVLDVYTQSTYIYIWYMCNCLSIVSIEMKNNVSSISFNRGGGKLKEPGKITYTLRTK